MSEIDKLLKKLDKFEKKVTKTKASSNRFLRTMGVLTPKGNIARRYQGVICTQPKRG